MKFFKSLIDKLLGKLMDYKQILSGEQKAAKRVLFRELLFEGIVGKPEIIGNEVRTYFASGFYEYQATAHLVISVRKIEVVVDGERRVVTSVADVVQESYFAWKNSYREGREDVNYDWRYPDPFWSKKYKKYLDFNLRRAVELRLDDVA